MGSRLLENYKFAEIIDSDLAPDGSCEFVGESVVKGSKSRLCNADGGFCGENFDKPEVFALCPTRQEKLKQQRRS